MYKFVSKEQKKFVALLAEGVDRNICHMVVLADLKWSPSSRRAWIEIFRSARRARGRCRSPSSRRAWIEILQSGQVNSNRASPSSRRAWIEIAHEQPRSGRRKVALLAEGVDRNISIQRLYSFGRSRPPRGGRG